MALCEDTSLALYSLVSLLFRALSNKPDMRGWSNQKDWIGLETYQWYSIVVGLITQPVSHSRKAN